MSIKNITIIGAGLIGGSLAAACKRRDKTCHITAISSPNTLKIGKELEIIDAGMGYDALAEGVAEADLVFICTPIMRIIQMLPTIMQSVKPGAIVTDVGSTKRTIMATAAKATRNDCWFVGGHPMAGSEKTGISASDPFLFENAVYVLTPPKNIPTEHLNTFSTLLSDIGANVIHLQPTHHDRIAAAISHLPQLLAVSLVNAMAAAGNGDTTYESLAAGGFRDMTRIASSSYAMWQDICVTNKDLILEMLEILQNHIQQTGNALATDSLNELFTSAATTRGRMPISGKGLLYPHPEVLVVAADQPKMLARITGALGDADININDIEVLKVREGEGGTIRISVPHSNAANQAVTVLRNAGFEARIR